MASMAHPRWYHSVALLLPDGRLFSAGGDDFATAEIYSPPYLFKGPRPSVDTAPNFVGYGQHFDVGMSGSSDVSQVNLVRMGGVTHAFNFDQRLLKADFTATADGLSLTAPSDPNQAPPGYYMMFVVNSNGVPSVAKMVQIGSEMTLAPDGKLTVNGGGINDAISFTESGGTITGMINGIKRDFAASAISSIDVLAGAGDDTLIYNLPSSKPIVMHGDGKDTIKVLGGTYVFNTDAAAEGASVTLNVSGSVTFNAPQHLKSLTLTAGHAAVTPGGSNEIEIETVKVTGNGQIDLADNDMIATGMADSDVQALLESDYIFSSRALGQEGTTVLGLGETDEGVYVKYTWFGDANLDGAVNIDDFTKFLEGWNNTRTIEPRWITGDFDGNGFMNFDDFNKFLIGYNRFNQLKGLIL
jgi:hypothetical protein